MTAILDVFLEGIAKLNTSRYRHLSRQVFRPHHRAAVVKRAYVELRERAPYLKRLAFWTIRAEEAAEGKVVVIDPFKCQVGCSSCANVCAPRAITFPPRGMLDAYRPGGR